MIGIGEYNFCFCRSAQGFAKLFFSRSGFNPYPAPRNRVVCAHLTKSVFKVSDDAFFKLQSKETKVGVQRRFPPPRYSRAESATANTVPCGDLPGRGHNAEYSDVNNLRGTNSRDIITPTNKSETQDHHRFACSQTFGELFVALWHCFANVNCLPPVFLRKVRR
jgi:hypothetical protein